MLAAILFLGIAELKDNVTRMHNGADNDNLVGEYQVKQLQLPPINFNAYQAILPIPYYCSGSQDYEYTIDPDPDWFLFNMLLSLRSKLPLMSYIVTRAPVQHNIDLLNMVALDSISTDLASRLNKQPILVAVNKSLVASNNASGAASKNAELLYSKAANFAERNKAYLKPIDSLNNIVYYTWYPKQH